MTKILKAMNATAIWAEKALADGKVTKIEALKLAIDIAGALGLPVEDGWEYKETVVDTVENEGLAKEKEPPKVIKPEE